MLITRKSSITTERAEEETTPATHHARRAAVRAALLAVPQEHIVAFAVALFAHLRETRDVRGTTEAQARALALAEAEAEALFALWPTVDIAFTDLFVTLPGLYVSQEAA